MADRRLLTDRYLKALAPAPHRERVEVWDARIPGFGVRISHAEDAARRGRAGLVTFVLNARFSSGSAPTRRVIGVYGAITLEEARRIAGEWKSQIARGIDPETARQTAAREAALRARHSFAAVAETFIADKLKHERSGKIAERYLRSTFVAAWGERPISEITTLDVLEIVNAKKRSAPLMARALLVLVRRFFNWVVDSHIYGLERSPTDRLKMEKIIGPTPARTRRLNDEELFAFWRATGRMKYPVGSAYRLLLLTGLRRNEAAKLAWSEVQGDLVTIPPERMKAETGSAREHALPLSSMAREVIASVPRYRGAQFVFSSSAGLRPLQLTYQHKRELDRRMLRTLRALARRRGEEHVTLPHWVVHDLRRVVRSGLAALRVPFNVCEAVLAHRPPGISGVYDGHSYLDEKREALEAWARRLASIAAPPASNVVALRRAR